MLPIHPSYLLFPVPIALHFPRFRCWCRVVGSVLALSSVLNFVKNNTAAALYILHSHTGFLFLFPPSPGAAEGKGDPAGKIARRREAPQRGPTVQRGRSNVLRRRAKRKCWAGNWWAECGGVRWAGRERIAAGAEPSPDAAPPARTHLSHVLFLLLRKRRRMKHKLRLGRVSSYLSSACVCVCAFGLGHSLGLCGPLAGSCTCACVCECVCVSVCVCKYILLDEERSIWKYGKWWCRKGNLLPHHRDLGFVFQKCL